MEKCEAVCVVYKGINNDLQHNWVIKYNLRGTPVRFGYVGVMYLVERILLHNTCVDYLSIKSLSLNLYKWYIDH